MRAIQALLLALALVFALLAPAQAAGGPPPPLRTQTGACRPAMCRMPRDLVRPHMRQRLHRCGGQCQEGTRLGARRRAMHDCLLHARPADLDGAPGRRQAAAGPRPCAPAPRACACTRPPPGAQPRPLLVRPLPQGHPALERRALGPCRSVPASHQQRSTQATSWHTLSLPQPGLPHQGRLQPWACRGESAPRQPSSCCARAKATACCRILAPGPASAALASGGAGLGGTLDTGMGTSGSTVGRR